MDDKPVFSFDFAPNGGDVMAIVYWPCTHRWPKRWWHRLRGQGTHVVVTDTTHATTGNELTIKWDAKGRFEV